MTHSDYTLVGLGVLAILFFALAGYFWSKSEDLQADLAHVRGELAVEILEHTGTKQRLRDTESRVHRMAGLVTPLMEKTAWSMGGVSLAQMRSAEVRRNEAIDRYRSEFMRIPVVDDTGKQMARDGALFGTSL